MLETLPRGELTRRAEEIAARQYDIPDSQRISVSVDTLLDWSLRYRRGGFDALAPKPRQDRGQSRAITPQLADLIERLKRENPHRTGMTLLRELALTSQQNEPGVSASTLYRFLKQRGLTERQLIEITPHKKFEAQFSNQIWQADMLFGPYVRPGGGGMTFQIRVVTTADNGQEQAHEITSVQRTELKPETLGLTLAEGKAILGEIQRVFVEQQTAQCVAAHRPCSDCGQPRSHNGRHDLALRTVFGKITIQSPRFVHCGCQSHQTKSFSPLAQVLPEHTTPELLFLETKWSSLISYGLTADLLQEVLPMDSPLHTSTIREHVLDAAQRLEGELGEEQWTFIEGCQRDWDKLPPPDGPLTVGIDGGYVRGRNKEGHFEVIAGKSLLTFRREAGDEKELSSKCFAFVQTYDEKPKRRLFEVLRSQGLQMNQQVEFLSDGGEDVRNVQLYLNPEAEHLLDWFHITMRLTVMNQIAKGLPEKVGEGEDQYELRPGVLKDLESLKWYLWHGNVFQALKKLEGLEMDVEGAASEAKEETARKLLKGIEELHTYVERNQAFIPNYGERYRNGERIASGFVESAVNQVVSKRMVKHQQMQWTQRGAHMLLQIRTRVINEEWEDTFRRWFPGFRPQNQEQRVKKAA